jgi:anti-anti-sigma factor
MDLAVTSSSGTTVMSLTGQLDIDTAPRLREAVGDLLRRSVNRIVVDLGGLTFCDSIGLSTFVVAHRGCTAAGGHLRLAAPNPFMWRVVSVVGLPGRLPIYRTVVAACCGDPADLMC